MNTTTMNRLREIGVLSVDDGLVYCDRNEELYLMVLQMYVDKAADEKMEASFESEQWMDYRIIVHSLKNESKTVGLDDLSNRALLLEQACKDSDYEYIKKEHHSYVADYKSVVQQIRACMN